MNPHTEDLISKHEVIKNDFGWEEIEISKRIYFKGGHIINVFFYYLKMFQCPLYSVSEGFLPKMSIWQLRRKV